MKQQVTFKLGVSVLLICMGLGTIFILVPENHYYKTVYKFLGTITILLGVIGLNIVYQERKK